MILSLVRWAIYSLLVGLTHTILVMAIVYVTHKTFSMFMELIETQQFYYSADYRGDYESKPEIAESTKDLIAKISRGPEEEGAEK